MKNILPAVVLIFFFHSLGYAQTNGEFTTFPISLKYFQAKKTVQSNQLQWLAPCITAEATFEIQHSTDGRNFTTLNTFTADQIRCTQPFDYFDVQRREGTNYYRIKMIAQSNVSLHSFVVAVFNGNKGFAMNALLPSLVNTTATLNISSAINDLLQLFVTDVSGKRFLVTTRQVVAGNNNLEFNFYALPRGQYILSAVNKENEVKKIQFLKL